MSNVFVVDTYQRPLSPVHPGRARILLKEGKAAVYRRYPFTVILKGEVPDPEVQPLRIKLDPGSRTTGIAIVNDATGTVVFAAELAHRGHKIKATLIECGSGGLTKHNRCLRELPKTHWLDASCVGKRTPEVLITKHVVPLLITATGHGSRQMCLMDRYGFPRTKAKGEKKVKGFQTGDIVNAVVTTGTKQGACTGRVAVRSTGSFNIVTPTQTIQGISYRFCRIVHHTDGYSYTKGSALPPHA